MSKVDPGKYIVFKREDFNNVLGHPTEDYYLKMMALELRDAVVIRRQDSFASPCLLTYAAMISMVAQNHPDIKVAKELMAISDYFHEQGMLAGEEGYKLPTI